MVKIFDMRQYWQSTFVKNVLVYSGINVVNQIITLIKGFLVRRILPPEVMGFWNFVDVVQGFIGTFDLGCITGANRELPMMRGKHAEHEEIKIRSTTLWFTLGQNIVISLVTWVYVWWRQANYLPWEIVAIWVGSISFIFNGVQLAYSTFFAAAQGFVPLSRLLLICSIIEGVSMPLCAYVWGLGGIMAMAVINVGLRSGLFLLFGYFANLSIQRKVFGDVLKRLLSFGFSVRLLDYPYYLFNMASILWVTKFMNIEALAFFSMARGFFVQVVDICNRAGTVYAMRFLQQAGSGISRNILAKQLKQYLLFQLLVVVPLLCWAASVFFPFLVRNFIPQYAEANPVILVLLICSFFYVLNSGLTNPWIMEKKLIARGTANVIALSMMVISLSVPWFLFGRRTIIDVAYSTLAGYFLYFGYMVFAVGKDLWRWRDSGEIILTVTAAAGWTFFIVHKGSHSLGVYPGLIADVKATLFMGGWTLLAILPVPLYGLERSQIHKGWVIQ